MESLLAIAKDAAQESARIVMSYYGNQAFTEKEDLSPLTHADSHVHEYLSQVLGETGIPVFSEEGEVPPLPYPPRLWIIDPIDGTRGFINKTDDFAVMIGLLIEGRPALGIVLAPATNTIFFATNGGGAFIEKDGTIAPLKVSERNIPDLRGVTSRNHAAPYMKDVDTALEVTETLAIGGIGIKAGILAEGKGDYFLTLGNLGEWDVCAPEIILREAGGKVSDRNGDPLEYGNPGGHITSGAVFSNGVCHREVLTALSLSTRQRE